MSYIKTMYGDQSHDFIKGFLAAIDTYAVWLNGERFIGSPEINIHKAMKEAVTELGGMPEDYLDLNDEYE